MLLEALSGLQLLLQSELALALALFGLTATLIAFCVPGTIVPLSLSSAALLGGWQGTLVVSGGALLGSLALFLATRHFLQERIRKRLGNRLDRFEAHFARRGFFYVLGLRVAGVPHFVVTAGCALSPLRVRSFAAATLLGLLPVISLSSAAAASLL